MALTNKDANENKNTYINKKLLIASLAVYLVILLWVIIFKCNRNDVLHITRNLGVSWIDRIEKVPFTKLINGYKKGYFSRLETIALVFNVICLLPFGALFRFIIKRRWVTVLLGAAFSIAVEAFQVFSGWGGLEYVDIMTNTLGVVFGTYIYDCLRYKLSDRCINRAMVGALIVGVPCAIFVTVRTIINFPI